jgi:hypothetical protein
LLRELDEKSNVQNLHILPPIQAGKNVMIRLTLNLLENDP